MLERATLISFDRDSYTASVRFADSLASVSRPCRSRAASPRRG